MNKFEGKLVETHIVKKNTDDHCVPTNIVAYGRSNIIIGLRAQYNSYVSYDLPFKTFDLSDQNNRGLKDYYTDMKKANAKQNSIDAKRRGKKKKRGNIQASRRASTG